MRTFTVSLNRIAVLVLLLLTLGSGAVIAQQEDVSPLLQMLELTPDDVAVTEAFSYVDFRAVTESRPGAATITTVEQFEALSASEPPANPFGGMLGRRQPVLVGDNLVASSASTERLKAQAEAIAGTAPTLAENADYRAIAEAVTQDGALLQAWFIDPMSIAPLTESAFAEAVGSRLSPAEIEALFAELIEEFMPIPSYSLLALADTATESEQIALVALVYTNADDAETAAGVITQRIESYVSLAIQRPLRELLEDRGVEAVETEVYEGDERAVLIVRLRGDLAPAEPAENMTQLTSSSLIFNLLVNMYIQRDSGWLAMLP